MELLNTEREEERERERKRERERERESELLEIGYNSADSKARLFY
jgi:hypothetical protein